MDMQQPTGNKTKGKLPIPINKHPPEGTQVPFSTEMQSSYDWNI
jgi:hypothetical protein